MFANSMLQDALHNQRPTQSKPEEVSLWKIVDKLCPGTTILEVCYIAVPDHCEYYLANHVLRRTEAPHLLSKNNYLSSDLVLYRLK